MAQRLSLALLVTLVLAPSASAQRAADAADITPMSALEGPMWQAAAPALHRGAAGDAIARALATTAALPEDAYWEHWVTPAQDGVISTAGCEFQGKLIFYPGGGVVGRLSGTNVWAWDGAQFEALPSMGSSSVTAFGVWNDHLVAITRSPNAVKILDGGAWSVLGTANDQIFALTTFAGDLVIGGQFTTVNGVPAVRVARFDGTSWSALGAGIPAPGRVQNLVVHAGSLVAGGTFSTLKYVAAWDSVSGSWLTLGDGFNASVVSLLSDGAYLYASGSFTQSGTSSVSGFVRWDGVSWQGLLAKGDAVGQLVSWNGGIATSHTSGASRLAHWDGALTQLPDSLSFGFAASFALGTYGDKLVITGNFINNGSTLVPGVLLYDGTTWSTIGIPWASDMLGTTGQVSDLLAWNGQLIAGGEYALTADQDRYVKTLRIGAWDGSQWSALGVGLSSPFYVTLGAWNGDLIAGGYDLGPWASPAQTSVARWDGVAWSSLGTANTSLLPNAFAEYHTDLYAAFSPLSSPGIGRWNGSSWQPVGGDISSETAPGSEAGYALTAFGDQLILGGSFTDAGTTPANNVAAWDGTAWAALGDGFNDYVNTLIEWNGQLVAGGNFTASGAQPLHGAAVWDGTSWQPLGDNANYVSRLRTSGSTLFASGEFRLPDASVVETVARWTGSDWHPLGSGPGGGNFEIHDGYLYDNGSGLVHGHVSHGISRLPLAIALSVPATPGSSHTIALAASPNPSRASTNLAFTLPTAGRIRLSIHDVSGRCVATLVNGPVEAGAHTVRWSAPARPGVYFARLEAPGGFSRVTRVVRFE